MNPTNQQFTFLHQNFLATLVTILVLICFIIFGYLYVNRPVADTHDYSGDRNIEDNFVLPPQSDEKYLHFKEGNKLTIINYFSLDCPFCRRLFFEEKKIVDTYGDKVNFAFREKTLSTTPLHYENALIKECIYIKNENSDEKYFQFVDEVFSNYIEAKNNDWLKQIALKYISPEQLDDCLQDEKLKQTIIGFRAKADASQIVWTPTIVLFKNGVEVERIEKVWVDIYRKVLEIHTQ
jgi:protein-disulfide isomerase